MGRCFILIFLAISFSLIPPIYCITSIDNKTYLVQRLLIEIDCSENIEIEHETYNYIKNQLELLQICKTSNIIILRSDTVPFTMSIIPVSELRLIEGFLRNHSNDSNVEIVSLYLLCIQSTYIAPESGLPKSTILGVTYSPSSCAIFYPQAKSLEKSVILHEIGHTLLASYPGGGHCPNEKCLMHPIISNNEAQFDETCTKRLEALRIMKKQLLQRLKK